jgi:hypothetical protein
MPNIIGDIAGNYKTLMALLKKMPDDEVVSVGDFCDRGPSSADVIRWFMNHGKAIYGNHEDLMLDFARNTFRYQKGLWFYNGGNATYESFNKTIPEDVIKWIESLPLFMKFDDVFVSHAFVGNWSNLSNTLQLHKITGANEYSIIWNRGIPQRTDKYSIQIAGHNSQFGYREFSDNDGVFAYGIDTSRENVLTGIHIPSFTVYQQEIID